MSTHSNHPPTHEMQIDDGKHHLHPFSDNADLARKGSRIIVKAEGVHITDSEGISLFDAMSGLWCVGVGYGRSELADVAKRQMMELPYYNTFFQTTHPPAVALSKRLSEIAPSGITRAFYGSSGSEANDTNIRAVRTYWANMDQPERVNIIARVNGYHGSTMGGGSLGGMSHMHAQGGIPIPNIHHIPQPYWWGEGGDMDPDSFGLERARELEKKILELGPETVGAFIAEPIQGAGGVIIPPKTYWPEIQRICREYGILLIADEVITAFGRTGNWFGCQTFDIAPDIITTAKGITSGYIPLSASLFREEVAEVLANAKGEFNHGYTYSGHPVAAAVATENLRLIKEEKMIENVRSGAGVHLREQWKALADHPLIGEAVIEGAMGGIQLTPDKAARAKFSADAGTAGYICREFCFANGLVMRHVYDRMVISPPLIITESDVDELMNKVSKCLDLTLQKLKDEGLYQSA